jgi:hypothetical protein
LPSELLGVAAKRHKRRKKERKELTNRLRSESSPERHALLHFLGFFFFAPFVPFCGYLLSLRGQENWPPQVRLLVVPSGFYQS